MENGKGIIGKDMESKSGQMEPGMRAIGKTTKPMVEGSLFTSTEMYTRGSGEMTKQMVLEYTSIQMGQPTKVTGRMTTKKEKVLKNGWMAVNTKASTKTERRTEKGITPGVTEVITKGTG